MVYDQKYSLDVSLSEILDQFILDEEKPELIVQYLETHKRDIFNLVTDSTYFNRILNYDFVSRLEWKDIVRFYDTLLSDKDITRISLNDPFRIPVVYSLWQCYISDKFDQRSKSLIRERFCKITEKARFRHPYSRRCDKNVERMERDLLNERFDVFSTYETFSRNFSDGTKVFQRYVQSGGGLLKMRILEQYDFFSLCTREEKLSIIDKSDCANFFYQVIENEEDEDLKFAMYKHLKEYTFVGDFATRKEKSYPEMMMDRTLRGQPVTKREILELLMNKPRILVEWMEDDVKGMDSILPVSKIVRRIVDEGEVKMKRKISFNTLGSQPKVI